MNTLRLNMLLPALLATIILSGCATSSSLNEALRNLDFDAAKDFIEKGTDVNQEQSYSEGDSLEILNAAGQTPICFATLVNFSGVPDDASKQQGVIMLLINRGAKLDVECIHGASSPLMQAAAAGNLAVIKLLVENGANPNPLPKGPFDYTPLQQAYAYGHLDVADYLIKRGAKGGEKSIKHYQAHLEYRRQAELQMAREEEERRENERRKKADSRAFWKGAATLATGVAVGKATSGYTPDQQARMMKSSMKAVDSGDTSELTETTNQVKAEQAQSHKAKMQAIETEKERERAANTRANRPVNAKASRSKSEGNSQVGYNQNGTGTVGSSDTAPRKPQRCIEKAHGSSFPRMTEAAARSEALQYAQIGEGGMGNLKSISSKVTSCKHEDGLGYTCYAETKYEVDSLRECGLKSGPSAGKSK